jgi:hypothetical protein
MTNGRLLLFIAAVLPVTLVTSGCATSPYAKDRLLEPDRVEINSTEKRDKLSYLGRFLLSADLRRKQAERIRNSYSEGISNAAPMTVGVGMLVAQAANGSVSSS